MSDMTDQSTESTEKTLTYLGSQENLLCVSYNAQCRCLSNNYHKNNKQNNCNKQTKINKTKLNIFFYALFYATAIHVIFKRNDLVCRN